MTVPVASTETVYALMGTTLGAFSTVWPYNAASDVTCQVDYGAGGGPELLVQGADYTLTASNPTLSNGGSVVLAAHVLANFGAAWGTGAVVILARGTPRTQPSSYGEAVGFSPKGSEQALDNVARQVQELNTEQGRAVSVAYGEPGTTLPPAALRAGMLAMWDSTAPAPFIPLSAAEAQSLFKGDPGGNVMAVGLFGIVPNINVPVGTDLIQTSGYSVTGVGGARYALDPYQGGVASVTRVCTQNGRWFTLAEQRPHWPMFGADPTGVNPSDAAAAASVAWAAATLGASWPGPGTFLLNNSLVMPVGASSLATYAPDLRGEGMWQTTLKFSASAPNGIVFSGPVGNTAFQTCGIVCDMTITGPTSALALPGCTGVTFSNVHLGGIRRCYVQRFQRGVRYAQTILMHHEHTLVLYCGAAATGPNPQGFAQVEVDHSTTWKWNQSYISGGAPGCPAGLRLDSLVTFDVAGGAVESSGVNLQFASKPEGVAVLRDGIVHLDLECPAIPGAGAIATWAPAGAYIQFGYGWTGAAGGAGGNIVFRCSCLPSGASAVSYVAQLANGSGIRFEGMVIGMAGAPVCNYWLESSTHGTVVEPSYTNYGYSWPYVMVNQGTIAVPNGVQVVCATPLIRWEQWRQQVCSSQTISTGGVNPSAQIIPQGGIAGTVYLTNAATTNVLTIAGAQGSWGCEINVIPQDANTVLTYGLAANGIIPRTLANYPCASKVMVRLVSNNSGWMMAA